MSGQYLEVCASARHVRNEERNLLIDHTLSNMFFALSVWE